MKINDFENLIKNEVNKVVCDILKRNQTLEVQVRRGERVGDAISKFLESKFVEYTQNHKYFKDSEASPSGKTKNPWDAQTYFKTGNHQELIWIDFKAVNVENDNSNPDSGTPNKVFELILKHNSFYLLYIVVYYEGLGTGRGLKFVNKKGLMMKSIFLKDIEQNMHITPSNQIQFNVFANEQLRTREEFLEFLKNKIIESNERKYKDALRKLRLLKKGKYKVPKTIYEEEQFEFEILMTKNEEQENQIKKI